MRERGLQAKVGLALAKLREPTIQRNLLVVVGTALLATILLPIKTNPTLVFAFSGGQPKWSYLFWPILAGSAYLFVAAAPPHVRSRVPHIVLRWIPFAVSFLGVFMMSRGGGGGDSGGFAGDSLYVLGYATLVFGLLSHIAHPQDQVTRIVIALGAGMLIPAWIDMIGALHVSGLPVLLIITSLLHFVVTLLGIACLLILVPAPKLPPALQAVDTFAPVVAAILILWLPTMVVLFGVVTVVHFSAGIDAVFWLVRALVHVAAFFGVLFMTSPGAYEDAKAMLTNETGPGGPPPSGGNPPPSGGGYPPPGGGFPPQGGGNPPPQGGGWQ